MCQFPARIRASPPARCSHTKQPSRAQATTTSHATRSRHCPQAGSPGGGHRAPGPRQQPLSPRVAHVIETGPCSPPSAAAPTETTATVPACPRRSLCPVLDSGVSSWGPHNAAWPHLWASNRLPNGGCLQACWPCHASTNKNLHGDSHSLPTRPPSVLGAAISPLGVWFAFSCFLWCRLMSISCECHAVTFMNCPKGRHWNGKSRKIR